MPAGPELLLTTQLYAPRVRAGLVPRLRLLARLDAGLETPLTVVTAPAGFGKTAMLAAWQAELRARGMPVGWLTLEDGDNDPIRFWSYILAALARLAPGIREALQPLLSASPPVPPESLVTALMTYLADARGVLILDDFHAIQRDEIKHVIAFLVDHMAADVHLVLASRSEPSLPLARWRVRGDLTELGARDLRFSHDEVRAFLAQAEPELTPAQADILEARTEGWIAGLHLAVLALRQRDDPSKFISAFAGYHRYIVEYLTQEVLERQPEDIREFLLRTSVLERLTSAVCDELTDRTDSALLLERLAAENVFVSSLDEQQQWYRYHQLFVEALRDRLRRTHPDLPHVLHARASEWFARNEMPAEAIRHALAAGDADRAARLVEDVADAVWTRSQAVTLLAWLADLPPHVRQSRPRLAAYRAWGLFFTGQLEQIEAALRMAEQGIGASDSSDPETIGIVSAVRACVASMRGEASRCVEHATHALEQLPESNVIWRGVVGLSLGTAYLSTGEVEAARPVFEEATRASRAAGNRSGALWGASNLALLEVAQGRLHEAAASYRGALEDEDPGLPMSGLPLVGLGEVLYAWDELEAALTHSKEGIDRAERGKYVEIIAAGHTSLARVHLARGDLAAAQASIDTADDLVRSHNVTARIASQLAAVQVQLWLASGHIARAERWLLERHAPLDYRTEDEHLAQARVLVRLGEPHPALDIVARVQLAAEVQRRFGSRLATLVLQAVALSVAESGERARDVLRQALAVGEPSNHIRVFADEGEPIRRLLLQMREKGPYVSSILAAIRPTGAGAAHELLSERELEVLGLMSQGLGNAQIATELVVSIGTVKTHVNHIFDKLDVHTRTAAVTEAQRRGLLRF
jgi:LuxR family maltose regulon positive regulatory protein